MIREAIYKLVDKDDLTYDEAYSVINEIMSGETTPTQTAAFLAALSTKSTKSETIDEIAGCAAAMRSLATKVEYHSPVLEIVGTGGDKSGSFNISTTAAFVIAAGGIKVAKHGNRAASSKSGAADCLEALGAQIVQDPDVAIQMLDEVGMCFFFAQRYHAAMKYVGSIRKELGIRTVFNILGPLTNPASPEYFVLGVYDESLVEPLAHVLSNLGVKKGVVVYGRECIDELSPAGENVICDFCEGIYKTFVLGPEHFGMEICSKDDLKGGSAMDNASTAKDILKGVIDDCRKDAVVLNAGAGLYVGGAATSLEEGAALANDLIRSGKAYSVMESFIETSNRLSRSVNG